MEAIIKRSIKAEYIAIMFFLAFTAAACVTECARPQPAATSSEMEKAIENSFPWPNYSKGGAVRQ